MNFEKQQELFNYLSAELGVTALQSQMFDIEHIIKGKNKMTLHELKILPEFYWPVWTRSKNFEIRFNDRDFKVGDLLLLKEFSQGQYTGNSVVRKITFIYSGPGVEKDYVILSIK